MRARNLDCFGIGVLAKQVEVGRVAEDAVAPSPGGLHQNAGIDQSVDRLSCGRLGCAKQFRHPRHRDHRVCWQFLE